MKFEDLTFIRLTQPDQFRLIPPELFEQVKEDPDVIVENLYKFGPEQLNSQLTFLYIMVDPEDKTKGVLWAGVNEFTNILEVSILSVDKEYQDGKSPKIVLEFLQKLQKILNLSKIRFMTTRGKNYTDKYKRVYKEIGLKESNILILEI
ncbi:hypothetical protein LCGC14_1801790 [marine sediment metagenome]|uniref:N-acetyltransferase domain-containing protein n=1 Tax=marine sediment metagenome TaxID=412755 RepID=A0A0F9HC58_9ZZZZ